MGYIDYCSLCKYSYTSYCKYASKECNQEKARILLEISNTRTTKGGLKMFDDIVRDNISSDYYEKEDNKKIYCVLKMLREECNKYEYCYQGCKFYNKDDADCYLFNPCDYEMEKIAEVLGL